MAREQLLLTCVLLSIALCTVHPTAARRLLQGAEQQCSQACFDAAVPNFDVGSSFLYFDAGCTNGSLTGCQASTGCRLCQVSGDASNPQCPQCVCDYYAGQGNAVTGCIPSSTAAPPPAGATSPPSQSSTPPPATSPTPPPQPAGTPTPPAGTPPSPLAAPPSTPTAPQGNTTFTMDLKLVGPQSVLIPFDLEHQQQLLLALTQAVPALGSSVVSFTSITQTGRRLRRTLLQDPSVTVLAVLSVTTAAAQAPQLLTDIQTVISSGAVTANLASQGLSSVTVSSASPPPAQTPVPPTGGGSGGSTSVGAIVGGAVGGVAVLLLLAALAVFFVQRRRRGQTSAHPSIMKPTHKSPLSSTAASAAGNHQPRVADSVQMVPSTPSPKAQGLIVTENKSRLSLDSSLPYMFTSDNKQQGEMKWLQAPSPPMPVSAPNSRPPSFDVRRGMDDPKREPTSGRTFAMSAADRAWRSVELSKEMVQQVADTYGPEEAAPSSPPHR